MERILQEAAAKAGLSVEELLRMTGLVADPGRVGLGQGQGQGQGQAQGQPQRPGYGEQQMGSGAGRGGGGGGGPELSSAPLYLHYGAAPFAPSAGRGPNASGWDPKTGPESRKRPFASASGHQQGVSLCSGDVWTTVREASDVPAGEHRLPSHSSPLDSASGLPTPSSHGVPDGARRRTQGRPAGCSKGPLGLDLNLGLPSDDGGPSASASHKDARHQPALSATPSEYSWPGPPSTSAHTSEQRPTCGGGLFGSIFPTQSGATGNTDSFDSRQTILAAAAPRHTPTHSLQLSARGPSLTLNPATQQVLEAALSSSQMTVPQLQALLLAALPEASRGSLVACLSSGGAQNLGVPPASGLSSELAPRANPSTHDQPGACSGTPTDNHTRGQGGAKESPRKDPYSTPVAQAREAPGEMRPGLRGSQSSKRSGDSSGGGGKGSGGRASLAGLGLAEGPEEDDVLRSDDEDGSMLGEGEEGDGFHLDESTFQLGSSIRKIALEKKRRHQLSALLRQLKRVTGGCGTKVEVVQRAIEAIKGLKARVAELESRVSDLEGQLLPGRPGRQDKEG